MARRTSPKPFRNKVKHLLIFEYLEQNAKLYPDEVALVEISPKFDEVSPGRITPSSSLCRARSSAVR